MLIKIAFRNIFRQKRRTLLTALSMFGGFVLAAFFFGWADGSYNTVINMFTRNRMGHIQIHHKDYMDRPGMYKWIAKPGPVNKILTETPGIESWAPRLYGAGLASVGEKTAGVRIVGVDPEKEEKTTNFSAKVVDGKSFSKVHRDEAILGKGLARILKTRVGDEVVILSQAADGSIANEKYNIVGIADSSDEISDRMDFYLSLSAAQELLVMENKIHEIAVTTHELDDVSEINTLLTEKLKQHPTLSADPWMEFAKTFYNSMEADKQGMYVMLLVIVMVVAVGVLNTVLMSVLERRREYGVLKAVGTRPWQIIGMVLTEVNCLAILCVIAGTIVGLGLNYLFSIYGFTLSEPMTVGGMAVTSIHGEINARSFYIPAITVIISATVVSILPAIKAALTDPAKSMKTH